LGTFDPQLTIEDLVTRLEVDAKFEEEIKRDPAKALAQIALERPPTIKAGPITYRTIVTALWLSTVGVLFAALMWLAAKQVPQLLVVLAPPEALPPPHACLDSECLLGVAHETMTFIYSNISYWDHVSYWSAVSAILFGTIATIMIALQGDTNRYWTRPVGIIATSLVTGIGGLTTSLHVTETIDKLVAVYSTVLTETNSYSLAVSAKDVSTNPRLAMSISVKFAQQLNEAKAELLKIKGSAARMDIKLSDQGVRP
jgi:hypothetical protein